MQLCNRLGYLETFGYVEYEWNDSTLEFQFQSPDHYRPYQEGMRKPSSAEDGQKYSPATQIYLVD